jgi:hypothetical protein
MHQDTGLGDIGMQFKWWRFRASIDFGDVILKHPHHGPNWAVRSHWRFLSWDFVRIDVQPPSWGKRLWIYTPWGSMHFDYCVRRAAPARRAK